MQGRILPLFKIMIFSPWTNRPVYRKDAGSIPDQGHVPGFQVQFWPQSGASGRQPINVSISFPFFHSLKNPPVKLNK